MVQKNPRLTKIRGDYLFTEIAKHKAAFIDKNPNAQVIDLSTGDTTEPIPRSIICAFQEAVRKLGNREGYTGYESVNGQKALRKAIARKVCHGRIHCDEIFVSDGAKCDLGRMQLLFGNDCPVAIQDPSYPAYIRASVIGGKERLFFMACTPENDFFPDLTKTPPGSLIYLCSPNNPTGKAFSHGQLETIIAFARKNRSIIIFDTAYASFIQGPSLPRSIFEVEGAKEVALETGSFSKLFGFTGVRLGWTAVPKELLFSDGTRLHEAWSQICATFFNGASNIAQAGGIAALNDEGLRSGQMLANYYMENARILREAIKHLGYHCYGGKHAPFLWVDLKGEPSWKVFHKLLDQAQLVTIPGAGFGPSGEGFLRISAFGHRSVIEKAAKAMVSSDLKITCHNAQ